MRKESNRDLQSLFQKRRSVATESMGNQWISNGIYNPKQKQQFKTLSSEASKQNIRLLIPENNNKDSSRKEIVAKNMYKEPKFWKYVGGGRKLNNATNATNSSSSRANCKGNSQNMLNISSLKPAKDLENNNTKNTNNTNNTNNIKNIKNISNINNINNINNNTNNNSTTTYVSLLGILSSKQVAGNFSYKPMEQKNKRKASSCIRSTVHRHPRDTVGSAGEADPHSIRLHTAEGARNYQKLNVGSTDLFNVQGAQGGAMAAGGFPFSGLLRHAADTPGRVGGWRGGKENLGGRDNNRDNNIEHTQNSSVLSKTHLKVQQIMAKTLQGIQPPGWGIPQGFGPFTTKDTNININSSLHPHPHPHPLHTHIDADAPKPSGTLGPFVERCTNKQKVTENLEGSLPRKAKPNSQQPSIQIEKERTKKKSISEYMSEFTKKRRRTWERSVRTSGGIIYNNSLSKLGVSGTQPPGNTYKYPNGNTYKHPYPSTEPGTEASTAMQTIDTEGLEGLMNSGHILSKIAGLSSGSKVTFNCSYTRPNSTPKYLRSGRRSSRPVRNQSSIRGSISGSDIPIPIPQSLGNNIYNQKIYKNERKCSKRTSLENYMLGSKQKILNYPESQTFEDFMDTELESELQKSVKVEGKRCTQKNSQQNLSSTFHKACQLKKALSITQLSGNISNAMGGKNLTSIERISSSSNKKCGKQKGRSKIRRAKTTGKKKLYDGLGGTNINIRLMAPKCLVLDDGVGSVVNSHSRISSNSLHSTHSHHSNTLNNTHSEVDFETLQTLETEQDNQDIHEISFDINNN